jgi:oligopeptide transport system ATP-binding protein
MPDPILELRDVKTHFPITRGFILKRHIGTVKAVDGVTLSIERGEVLGLVGESGCGKSTLARTIMQLLPTTAGTVVLEGRNLTTGSAGDLHRIRRDLQLVFQDPYASLNPKMPVNDIVGEPFQIHDSMSRQDRQRRVAALLDAVGLSPEHGNRYPHEFSGGQRQRIGIARALALDPTFIVLDEPVSALDVSVQAGVVNLLKQLQRERDIAYLFIAHDLSVVRHVSDRVAVMYLGKVVEVGERSAIYERPTHPYTTALLSAVPVPDPTIEKQRRRIVLEGDVPSPVDPPSGCRFRTRCWKAQDVCAAEEPPLVEREPGLWSACHFPVEQHEVATPVSFNPSTSR